MFKETVQAFYSSRNEELAAPMEKYMKNKFKFLGIKSVQRRELQKNLIKECRKSETVCWDFIFEMFAKEEREFQYLALDCLNVSGKKLIKEDIDKLETLVQTKSWWDTVDLIDSLIGMLCLEFPELKQTHIEKYIHSSSIWLKRISINYQLAFKEKTDREMLEKAIASNLDTKEFFVNKAVGWSLREFSKTDSLWVSDFIRRYKDRMPALSIREASKYLNEELL